jgi:hypothetical protein
MVQQRCTIGSGYVRDNDGRSKSLLQKKFSQQFQRGSPVAPSQDQHIENFAFVIVGSPHIHLHSLPANRDHHRVQMPPIMGPGRALWRFMEIIDPNFKTHRRTDSFLTSKSSFG